MTIELSYKTLSNLILVAELKNNSRTQPTKQFIEIHDAEKFFVPFELACKCKSPKVVETSLDCIQVH